MVPKSDGDGKIGQEWLRYNMDKTIRVLCKDGRLFEGKFHCIDSDGNIILKNGEWINGGYSGKERKWVGLSLYTKQWITKVYFKTPSQGDDNKVDTNNDQGPSEEDTETTATDKQTP